MTSYLELIIGPMFSGKTTYIINKYKLYLKENKKILCIKPNIDNRFINNKIVTHNQDLVNHDIKIYKLFEPGAVFNVQFKINLDRDLE